MRVRRVRRVRQVRQVRRVRRVRSTRPWLQVELWRFPRDNRVSLNGSGLAIVNPPYLLEERMREWLPQLHFALAGEAGGWRIERHNGV